jgi:hypothetical protein
MNSLYKSLALLFYTYCASAEAAVSLVKIPLKLRGDENYFTGQDLYYLAGPKPTSTHIEFFKNRYVIFTSWFGDRYTLTSDGFISIPENQTTENFLINHEVATATVKIKPTPGYPRIKGECISQLFSPNIKFKITTDYHDNNLAHSNLLNVDYTIKWGQLFLVENQSCFLVNIGETKIESHITEIPALGGAIIKSDSGLLFWKGGKNTIGIPNSSPSQIGKIGYIKYSKELKSTFYESIAGIFRIDSNLKINPIRPARSTLHDIPNSGYAAIFSQNGVDIVNSELITVQHFEIADNYPTTVGILDITALEGLSLLIFRQKDGIYALGDQNSEWISLFKSTSKQNTPEYQ